jgi:hypothetical protein
LYVPLIYKISSLLRATTEINHSVSRGPKSKVQRIAQRVLLSGELLTWPSPCGQNCSYILEFQGPAFECNNTIDNKAYSWYPNDFGADFSADPVITDGGFRYYAHENSPATQDVNNIRGGNSVEEGIGDGSHGRLKDTKFVLEIFWAPSDASNQSTQAAMTCFTTMANYTVNVTYINSQQKMNITTKKTDYLNPFFLLSGGTNSTIMRWDNKDPITANEDDTNAWDNQRGVNYPVQTFYTQKNLLAIRDSLVQLLTGSVYGDGKLCLFKPFALH